jgi:hypothetical protein
MTTPPRRRLIFHWTTPKNFLAILLFVLLTIIIQYIIVSTNTTTTDPTATIIPFVNITISPLYHLLPIAVIITLTASFTHLTTQTATIPAKTTPSRTPPPRKTRRKSTRLKLLRRFHKKLQGAARKIKNKILKTPAIAQIQRRIILAKAIIKSAATITATFIILILLITIAAYPHVVPTATFSFYSWNTVFLNFVAATIQASNTIANAIPPLGAAAAAVQNALIAASPTFHSTLEGAASAIASGLVNLNPTEKYVLIQNAAAWITAIATLVYSQYAKTRRYRR